MKNRSFEIQIDSDIHCGSLYPTQVNLTMTTDLSWLKSGILGQIIDQLGNSLKIDRNYFYSRALKRVNELRNSNEKFK